MSKLKDTQLTQSVDDLIRNKTDINSISPANVADALQNIIDSKVNRNSTAQGALKYYATYDAATQLDEFGEPIPLPVEQYEGRSYVVVNPGTVDLNDTGFFYNWKAGDIIVCLYAMGSWQWLIYGNVYGGESLPTGDTGQILINDGTGFNPYSALFDQYFYPSIDYQLRQAFSFGSTNLRYTWADDFNVYGNGNQLAFQVLEDARTFAWRGFYALSYPSESNPSLAIYPELPGVYFGNGINVLDDGNGILTANLDGVFLNKLLADNPYIASESEVMIGLDGAGKIVSFNNPYTFDNDRDSYISNNGTIEVNFNFRKVATCTVNGTGAVTLQLANKTLKPFKPWDDALEGGGLFTIHLKNNATGTPRVFTFDTNDFRLSSGTTITVGSALDSAPKVVTLQFFYYNGKLREISRSVGSGTGILLD